MKLHIVTIVLDGMPTLPALFFNFNALKVDWHWTIIEGAAANTSCTYWCNKQAPRLSEDGTHEFLQMISSHPRVRIVSTVFWPGGKVQMFNHALDQIKEEGVLLQCDADEVWQAWQLDRLVDAFRSDPSIGSAQFVCRYFLGVNILSATPNTYGNKPDEWLRAWRFTPGDKFLSHEPPNLHQRQPGHRINPEWLAMEGLMFDHYAYAFPNQVQYKEQFYGYRNAFKGWQSLQQNKRWPVKLKEFFGWVDDRATAEPLK
jgi:hypothetical protein